MESGNTAILDPSQLEEFRAISQVRLHPVKGRIFSWGQKSHGLYVLTQGRVKLTVPTWQGRSVILRIATPGEVLGLSEIMLNWPYVAAASALESCEVLYVEKSMFTRYLLTHEGTAAWVNDQLSRQLQDAYRQMRLASTGPTARGKLAALLLDLADRENGGVSTDQGQSFHLGLTRDEISGMIGSTRETVSRLLSQFQGKRLIRIEGSVIHVPDARQLKAILA